MRDGQLGGLGGERGVDAGRHDGEVEDAVDVVVLGDRVDGGAPVGGAGHEHAELDVERHPLLDDARHAPSSSPGRRPARPASATATWPLPS